MNSVTFDIDTSSTYLDYLENGLNFNLIAAIDLTVSNGTLDSHTSLHKINPSPKEFNEYQKCL